MIMQEHQIHLNQRPHLFRSHRARNRQGHSRYLLQQWWSLLLFEYRAELQLDDRSYTLKPGSLILVPPGVEKRYSINDAEPWHCFAHFRLRKSGDPCILPEYVAETQSQSGLNGLTDDFLQIIEAAQQQHILQAEVHLWHLLLRLNSHAGRLPEQSSVHPAARAARQRLEANIIDPLSLRELATEQNLSPNHLNALFKQHFGETVHACLIRLRMDQAQYLLQHSDRPVRDIAASIGIPDLQAFNKSVRRHFGHSPRAIRRS